ncbi:MAG: hypothetical protein AAGF12_41160 [Myxococcota bacterium]
MDAGFEALWRGDGRLATELLGASGEDAVHALERFWRSHQAFDDELRADASVPSKVVRLHLALGALRPHSVTWPSEPNVEWVRVAQAVAAFIENGAFDAPDALGGGAALRVEQMVLRSMAAYHRGDAEGAVRTARKAVRAAYAEALRFQELLAYWWLARMRRHTGNATAAARIASALARVAPVGFRPLVDWELTLAGGDESAVERELSHVAQAWQTVRRAAASHPPELAEALVEFSDLTLPAPFAEEQSLLLAGFQDLPDSDAVKHVAPAVYADAERLSTTPVVWRGRSDGPSVRQWCLASARPDELRVGFQEGARVQACLAALIKRAGEAIDEALLFSEVYGFRYDPAQHYSVFRVLLHRVRGCTGGVGRLEHQGSGVCFRLERRVVVPDPASVPSIEERLLRLIALSPGCSARDLATRSGLGLRTVQRTLRLMGETGVCLAEQNGRQLTYRVEDTTFHEPTYFDHEKPGAPR